MLAAGYCDLVIEAALNWDSGDRVVAAATPALWEQAVAALAGR